MKKVEKLKIIFRKFLLRLVYSRNRCTVLVENPRGRPGVSLGLGQILLRWDLGV
jgi:hypothetical protein